MAEAAVEKEQGKESVEDILHSIRDIIANETAGNAETEMAEEKKESDDILELTEVVEGEQPKPGSDVLDEIDNALNNTSADKKADPAKPKPASVEAPSPPPAAAKKKPKAASGLISENTAQASTNTIKKMIQRVPRQETGSPGLRSGATVEDLVVEALKPMLAEWLNKNLPALVRQVVEKEIRHILPRDD